MKIIRYIFIIACAVATVGCKQDNYATFSGYAQGTVYKIVAKNPGEGLGDRIEAVFKEIDNTFSMFNPESLVSRINRNETDEVTPLFAECFGMAKSVHAATDGWFDSTVKPLVDMWGFGPGEEQEIPCVECVMEYIGMDKIRVEEGRIIKDDPRVQLDFSSIAKGFTVDKLAEMLDTESVTDYMVDVGGEMRVKGVNAIGNPWRIGINKPNEGLSHELEAVVSFSGSLTSIATSGNYRNWFTDEHGRRRVHTIDPKTGLPAIGNILSVSIVGPDCGTADAWATGLMAAHDVSNTAGILPPAEFEYFIICSDETGGMQTVHSPGFPLVKE